MSAIDSMQDDEPSDLLADRVGPTAMVAAVVGALFEWCFAEGISDGVHYPQIEDFIRRVGSAADIAAVLCMRSRVSTAQGTHEEAIAFAQDAVTLLNHRSGDTTQAYRQRLAVTYVALAMALYRDHRTGAAITTVEAAILRLDSGYMRGANVAENSDLLVSVLLVVSQLLLENGDPVASAQVLQDALSICVDHSGETSHGVRLPDVLLLLSRAYAASGRKSKAFAVSGRYVALLRGNDGASADAMAELGVALGRHAHLAMQAGINSEAQGAGLESLTLLLSVPKRLCSTYFVASRLEDLAQVFTNLGDADRSNLALGAAIRILRSESVVGGESTAGILGRVLEKSARRRAESGDLDGVLEDYLAAVEVLRREVGTDESQVAELAFVLGNLGVLYAQSGEHLDAIGALEECLSLYPEPARFGDDASRSDDYSIFVYALARLYAMTSHEAAISTLERAVALYRGHYRRMPDRYLRDYARVLHDLGTALARAARVAEAIGVLDLCASVYLSGDDSGLGDDIGGVLQQLAVVQLASGQTESAMRTSRESLRRLDYAQVPDLMGTVRRAWSLYTFALVRVEAEQEVEEASECAARAHTMFKALESVDHERFHPIATAAAELTQRVHQPHGLGLTNPDTLK